MSSTRHAKEGSPYRDERYASSPKLNYGINGGRVADRCAALADPAAVELIWFIQWLSLRSASAGMPAGLDALAKHVVEQLPENIGTEIVHQMKHKGLNKLEGLEAWSAIREFASGFVYPPIYEDEYENEAILLSELISRSRSSAMDDIPLALREACLNPDFEPRFRSKFFRDLKSALADQREAIMQAVDADLVETSVAQQIAEIFAYIFEHGGLGLIEGEPGLGKSWAAERLCDKAPGLVRYVRIPSAPDDRSFFAAIAEALGVAAGANYSMNQIRSRVDSMLRKSKIGLVIDEAQLLWSQVKQPKRTPQRIEWVLEMSDAGAPMVLIGLPEFSEWRAHYVAKTQWKDAQLERRLLRYQRLPKYLTEDDLFALAQHFWPQGGIDGWKLLVGCALQNNQLNASAIIQVLDSARYRAKHDSRTEITPADVLAALKGDHSSSSNRFTLGGLSSVRRTPADKPHSNRQPPAAQQPERSIRPATCEPKSHPNRNRAPSFDRSMSLTATKGQS